MMDLSNTKLTDDIYTPEEISKILKVPASTMRYLLRRGDMIGFKVGRQYRITKPDLEAFIEDNKRI